MGIDWVSRLQDHTGTQVVRQCALGGGCIASVRQVEMSDGRALLVKTMANGTGPFLQEANGLNALRNTRALRVPEVLLAQPDILALEWIEEAPRRRDFAARLGRQLAAMHRVQAETFGFFEDNYIGATPQQNAPTIRCTDWARFYWRFRLEPQLQWAEQKGLTTPALCAGMERLCARLPDLLAGSEEPPCLIHGDLWSGNVISDELGHPCLIDPAVYYGHREAELAMTHLFGGFSQTFYDAYEEAYPLPPEHHQRIDLYKLYHVLNHLNLFGQSYLSQAVSLVRQYT